MSATCRRHVADTGKCRQICPKLRVGSDTTCEKRGPDMHNLCVVLPTHTNSYTKITTSSCLRDGRIPSPAPLLVSARRQQRRRRQRRRRRLHCWRRMRQWRHRRMRQQQQNQQKNNRKAVLPLLRKDWVFPHLLQFQNLTNKINPPNHGNSMKGNLLGHVFIMFPVPTNAAILCCH